MKPILYMLCGLPGSGKTACAKELEAANMGILLNADEWVSHLYPDDAETAARDDRKRRVEELQWDLAARLLAGGNNVILDWGFWRLPQREYYRWRAREAGASVNTIFLDIPIEVLHERVAKRNRNLRSGIFHISPEELDGWAAAFEPPTPEELAKK